MEKALLAALLLVLVATFPEAMHERMLWLPLLYALLVLVSASLLTLWWRRHPPPR